MERLKSIKNCIMAQVESQMGNLHNADTKELGEAIDMIKDLEEAIYYCTITKAMEESEENNNRYYSEKMMPYPIYCDSDYNRMYYTEGGGNNGNMSSGNSSSGGSRSYSERQLPLEFRDDREGRSPRYRKMYMESKEMHYPQDQKMKDLEKYLQELSMDIAEMVEGTSPDEKQMLKKKIAELANKING